MQKFLLILVLAVAFGGAIAWAKVISRAPEIADFACCGPNEICEIETPLCPERPIRSPILGPTMACAVDVDDSENPDETEMDDLDKMTVANNTREESSVTRTRPSSDGDDGDSDSDSGSNDEDD